MHTQGVALCQRATRRLEVRTHPTELPLGGKGRAGWSLINQSERRTALRASVVEVHGCAARAAVRQETAAEKRQHGSPQGLPSAERQAKLSNPRAPEEHRAEWGRRCGVSHGGTGQKPTVSLGACRHASAWPTSHSPGDQRRVLRYLFPPRRAVFARRRPACSGGAVARAMLGDGSKSERVTLINHPGRWR